MTQLTPGLDVSGWRIGVRIEDIARHEQELTVVPIPTLGIAPMVRQRDESRETPLIVPPRLRMKLAGPYVVGYRPVQGISNYTAGNIL
jgi:hypothetical protein